MRVLIYRNKLLVNEILLNEKYSIEEYLKYLPDGKELEEFFKLYDLKDIPKDSYMYKEFYDITECKIII